MIESKPTFAAKEAKPVEIHNAPIFAVGLKLPYISVNAELIRSTFIISIIS